MNHAEAEATLALLSHLDGSQTGDPYQLMGHVRTLHAAAAAIPRGGALPLDEDVIFDTLDEIQFRASIADDEDAAVEDVQINGDVL